MPLAQSLPAHCKMPACVRLWWLGGLIALGLASGLWAAYPWPQLVSVFVPGCCAPASAIFAAASCFLLACSD
ncbi:hypothetical protein J3F84DRAFT_367394 [Trichoderma pleuroticola]